MDSFMQMHVTVYPVILYAVPDGTDQGEYPMSKPHTPNYLGPQSIAKEGCPWEEVAMDGQSSHTNCHTHWILGQVREVVRLRCMSAFSFWAQFWYLLINSAGRYLLCEGHRAS